MRREIMCYAVGYATAVTLKLRLGCDSFRAYLYLGVLLWAQVTVGELVLRKTSMMFVPTMCIWFLNMVWATWGNNLMFPEKES